MSLKGNNRSSQYSLNRQMLVHKIPVEVQQEDLAETVSKALSLTGAEVTPSQLDKCHRLKNNSVIVEFKYREHRDPVLWNRKKLKDKTAELRSIGLDKIIVSESLCSSYQKLDFICRKLKGDDKIKDTWFFNRKLMLVDHGGKKFEIAHRSDLLALFDAETIDSYSTRQRPT